MKRMCFAFACLALSLHAAASPAPRLDVLRAWVRPTVAGMQVTAAYVTLRSAAAASLVGVRSPAAGEVMMHATVRHGGMMAMDMVDVVPLPAGQTVEFAPGGKHLMLEGLKKPLKDGETVPLELRVRPAVGKAFSVRVDAVVSQLPAGPAR